MRISAQCDRLFRYRDRRFGGYSGVAKPLWRYCVENATLDTVASTALPPKEPDAQATNVSTHDQECHPTEVHGNLIHEQIASTLKVSKGVVTMYVGLATVAGLDRATAQYWNELQLQRAAAPRGHHSAVCSTRPGPHPPGARSLGRDPHAAVARVCRRPPRRSHLALHAVL